MKAALLIAALLVPVQAPPMHIRAVCQGDTCQVKRADLEMLMRQNNTNAEAGREAVRQAEEALRLVTELQRANAALERKCREVRT